MYSGVISTKKEKKRLDRLPFHSCLSFKECAYANTANARQKHQTLPLDHPTGFDPARLTKKK